MGLSIQACTKKNLQQQTCKIWCYDIHILVLQSLVIGVVVSIARHVYMIDLYFTCTFQYSRHLPTLFCHLFFQQPILFHLLYVISPIQIPLQLISTLYILIGNFLVQLCFVALSLFWLYNFLHLSLTYVYCFFKFKMCILK